MTGVAENKKTVSVWEDSRQGVEKGACVPPPKSKGKLKPIEPLRKSQLVSGKEEARQTRERTQEKQTSEVAEQEQPNSLTVKGKDEQYTINISTEPEKTQG